MRVENVGVVVGYRKGCSVDKLKELGNGVWMKLGGNGRNSVKWILGLLMKLGLENGD